MPETQTPATPFALTVDAKTIAAALARVGKALPRKSAVQILAGVRMELDGEGGNSVLLSATDMDLTLRERVPVQEFSHGATRVILNAAKVLAGLQTLDGPLTFTADDESLAIRNGVTTLRYPVGDAADYPASPFAGEKSAEIAVDREAFLAAWTTIADCPSSDESRPVLCGVHIAPTPGGDALTLCATDSYRLGLATVPCSEAAAFLPMTVRAADLSRVAKLAAKGDGPLHLAQSDETGVVRLFVRDGERTASMRFIQGTYPNWRQLIPDNLPDRATFETVAASKALARIVKLQTNRNAPVRLSFSEGLMVATSTDYDSGAGIESRIPIESDTGLTGDIGLSPTFLGEAIEGIGGERVTLHIIGALRPVLVTEPDWTPAKGTLPERCHLVMPIRLAG